MGARTGRGFPSRPTNWSTPPVVVTAAASSFIAWPMNQAIQRSLAPADYTVTGTVTAILETHGFTNDATRPFQARLKNVTTGLVMGGSGVSSVATSKTRARSGSFSLTAGANVYQVEYGGLIGATYQAFDAVLVVTVTP